MAQDELGGRAQVLLVSDGAQHPVSGWSGEEGSVLPRPPQLPSSPQGQRVGVASRPSLPHPPLPAPGVTQVRLALFWPRFGLRAVEPPAGWLPRPLQGENVLALTP